MNSMAKQREIHFDGGRAGVGAGVRVKRDGE